ncbi:MAG: DNA recombination protein RmuC [Patescibacteria group bacterium]
MDPVQLILLVLVLVIVAVVSVMFFVSKQVTTLKTELSSDSDVILLEWLKEMKTSVDKNSDVLERQLKDHRSAMNEQTKLMWERLDNASKVIGDVQQHLGGLQEFGKDMKDLSNILKSPKLRGGLGEQFLYEILDNSLPKEMYKAQYKFRDGSVCDAIIITEKGIIPIDSKFPMENFKLMLTEGDDLAREKAKKVFVRDVKKRIDEISSKYILPEEGTTDQAVMYVPSENVYYELIVNTPEIEEYSKQKNVVLASPNTLSYFLKVILVAFQQHELQKHAGDILKSLAGIKVEAQKFEGELDVLDGHISRTFKSMDNVKSKYQRLFGKIESVHTLDSETETPLIDSDQAEVF